MMKAFQLDAALASKIASVIVHADEMFSEDGHYFDKIALQQAVSDPEIKAWIKSLGPLAPLKRRKA